MEENLPSICETLDSVSCITTTKQNKMETKRSEQALGSEDPGRYWGIHSGWIMLTRQLDGHQECRIQGA